MKIEVILLTKYVKTSNTIQKNNEKWRWDQIIMEGTINIKYFTMHLKFQKYACFRIAWTNEMEFKVGPQHISNPAPHVLGADSFLFFLSFLFSSVLGVHSFYPLFGNHI